MSFWASVSESDPVILVQVLIWQPLVDRDLVPVTVFNYYAGQVVNTVTISTFPIVDHFSTRQRFIVSHIFLSFCAFAAQ